MPIRQQSQELAGEAVMPCSVVGCCEVHKLSSGLLFSRKAILDVLCQQGDLVCGRPPVSKSRLLLWEQWINDWFDTSADESLEDFKRGHTAEIWAIALWVASGFSGLRIATILQIFGILSWRMQELSKSPNQDLRADPAWNINSGKWNPIPETFLASVVWEHQQAPPVWT